ncbi:hypothetical protein [Amycolatopsis sp. cmx-4-83]|uniref:hypothetical protein n=1 Tax=Amycolatopsis sp. cmx-4-83 TaxID=2790940 RepID=UPI0039783313
MSTFGAPLFGKSALLVESVVIVAGLAVPFVGLFPVHDVNKVAPMTTAVAARRT